ncbi:MAG: hypothetical protein EXR85_08080 [Xanthomonadales bacterium]|nr:hypothetical protein [Xanthomonadales bacterium]
MIRSFRSASAAFLLGLMCALPIEAAQQSPASDPALAQFKQAWQAANRGDRALFEQLESGLLNYVLYPYLQYADYESRRATISPAEMSAFLDAHADWAFTAGLRKSWLVALGKSGRWDDVLTYAGGATDEEIQCYVVQAAIQRKPAAEVLPQAQALWAVGKSAPDACDPVFAWLRKAGGITHDLAWLRVNRAMQADHPGLTVYLAHFVAPHDKVWLERWQQQDQQNYVRLDRARQWPNQPQAGDITAFGLQRLARKDADLAWRYYHSLKGKIQWTEQQLADLLREIAQWSAVANMPETLARMQAVPVSGRTDGLLEWWARAGLAAANWAEVSQAIAAMSDVARNSDRWRYWDSVARLKLGEQDRAMAALDTLSADATYFGFLAADFLNRPYAICAQDPGVTPQDLTAFHDQPLMRRVEALQAAGLTSWARREWNLNVRQMPATDRRLAAALATEQDRPDLAILALSAVEDRSLYDWRFPLNFAAVVQEQAGKQNIDPAWVLGLMRAESAMAPDAVSPADARGLMQVLPGTAAQLARSHGYSYRGSDQLMQVRDNVVFGTTFLRELMRKFNGNEMLVTGAYNAGPGAVKRWLESLPGSDAAIWVELLPYHETRDYIPKVLAFATIYDWRLQRPVQRISSRLQAPDSAAVKPGTASATYAEVACPGPVQVPAQVAAPIAAPVAANKG